MPVRDADSFLYNAPNLNVVGVNRGASGIDGVLSTAVGFSALSPSSPISAPLTTLIGDVALTHDIGGLKCLSDSERPVVVILVNNDGGQIFNFLPIAKHGEFVGFEEFWTTRTNGINFSKIVEGFGVSYVKVDSREDLEAYYARAMKGQDSIVIEAVVPPGNVKVHGDIRASLLPKPLPTKIQYSPNYRDPSNTVVFLHGFMGSASDFDKTISSLRASLPDRRFVSITLPGHFPGDNRISYDLETIATDVLGTVSGVEAVVGYSMGGRVALEMKRLNPELKVAVLGGSTEKRTQQIDISISDVDTFVGEWYSADIWGGVKDRETFLPMREKRVAAFQSMGKDGAERILRDSGNLRDYKLSPADLYVAGELDEKYMKILHGVDSDAVAIPKVGHAVLEEAPLEVANILSKWLGPGGKASIPGRDSIILDSLTFTSSPLNPKNEEKFARADLRRRVAFTVKLSSSDGAIGVGEAAPLNLLHPETAFEVEEALELLSSSISVTPFSFSTKILDLNNGMLAGVVEELAQRAKLDLSSLPSLQSGLESAMLILVGGEDFVGAVTARSGETMRNEVQFNTLFSQEGSSALEGGKVVKVKIGDLGDVPRVNDISRSYVTLRLDCNGQMTFDDAVAFGRSIKEPEKIEYVEEPLKFREGTSLVERVEKLSEWSRGTGIKYALDESLASGILDDFESLPGCGAIILKPSLLGYNKSWKLAQTAKRLGIKVVLTSCFDGAVGLAHLTWFSALLDDGEGVHGLSTFDRYAEENVMGKFVESVVMKEDRISVVGAANFLQKYCK